MGSLSSGFDTKEPGGILKRLQVDEVSSTKDRLYGRPLAELNKCFIEITGTRYNGSFLLRLNKDVDEAIYHTMKQIENTGGLQKRDKSLPRKGLSSVLKCLTQPAGAMEDPNNEVKPPMSVLKRTKRKFLYRPVRQISSLKKPAASKVELQNEEKSEQDLIGSVLDIFKSTLAQFKRSGGYATVEKGPQGREALVLHEADSTASSTVPKEGKVRIRFPKEALLVVQPPKRIEDSPDTDEFEISIEVKPSSIAKHASQTIKLAKDKVLIGMKDGEAIMQINEPPTKRSFHMTIEEDVKGKPCVKVNVTESKNTNENIHANEMVIEGPTKCDDREKTVSSEDEKGKQTQGISEENFKNEKFNLPDDILIRNIPPAEQPDGKQVYLKQAKGYSPFCEPELLHPESRVLIPTVLGEKDTRTSESPQIRVPIIVTELLIPRLKDNEVNAVGNTEHELGKIDPSVKGLVTNPSLLFCEKQNPTFTPKVQNEAAHPLHVGQARSISVPLSVNGEGPGLQSPFNKRLMECQNSYVKMGAYGCHGELSNAERRASWNAADHVRPPRHEPVPQWSNPGKQVNHFYSSMKLRKEFASVCHYPSHRELGESYPESLPSKFWDFCLRSRDSQDSRYWPQTFDRYVPKNNRSCFCRNRISRFSESEDPIEPKLKPAPQPSEIARVAQSSPPNTPKDKDTISVVNLALCGNYRNQHNGKTVTETKKQKHSNTAPRAKWTFAKPAGDSLLKPNTDIRAKQAKHQPRNRELDRARRIDAQTDLSKLMIDSAPKKIVYKEFKSKKPKNNTNVVPESSTVSPKNAKHENTFIRAIRDINGLLGRKISKILKLKPSNKSENRRIRT